MELKLFYSDPVAGESKTYGDLLQDIREQSTFSRYCKSRSYYEIFREIIVSILSDEEIVLLDSDFTDQEVENLIGDISLVSTETVPVTLSDATLESLQAALQRKDGKWKVTLFTSGTTGLPKKVSHSLGSISRYVKSSDRHKEDIWGFAYNPTHMAGLQVFFQALMNLNPMVRLFGYSREDILKNIQEYQITNISATPTFYRLLLPADRVLPSVVRITSGGEKFDSTTLAEMQKMFPAAKFTNVYASTEAGTLFASKGDFFTLKDEIKPYVKVINSELYLHKSLMGESESIRLDGDWYPTGDLIEIVEQEPMTFKFISRKNEMINVGGYKVNPTEVEAAIRTYPGIEDAFVYSKQNRILGNILMGEVVCLDNVTVAEKELRSFLKEKLQEFKIPRVIKFVDRLEVTRTGKISRKKE